MLTDDEWVNLMEGLTSNWDKVVRAKHGAALWHGTDAALTEVEVALKKVRALERELELARGAHAASVKAADHYREAMDVITGHANGTVQSLEVRRDQGWTPYVEFRMAGRSGPGFGADAPVIKVALPKSAADAWVAKRKADNKRIAEAFEKGAAGELDK